MRYLVVIHIDSDSDDDLDLCDSSTAWLLDTQPR